MSAIKIVDLSKDEKQYDFEESDFIIICRISAGVRHRNNRNPGGKS